MPDPVTGLIVGGTSLIGGALQSSAAKSAGNAQANANALGIEEQRRQFDAIKELLAPYVEAGAGAIPGLDIYMDAGEGALGGLQQFAEGGLPAFTRQMDLLGINGGGAQEAAIAGIENSPLFHALASQGEDAILQNASATGGLRGGSVQGALAQFRPAMLKSLIDQQYDRLGGIAGLGAQVNQNLFSTGSQTRQNLVSLGQNAAAGTGNAGMQTGQNISSLLQDTGAARAGSALASGQAWGNVLNLPAQFMGLKMAMGGTGGLF